MVHLDRLLDKECNFKDLSPLTLAFIGDGVFDLLVRENLVCGPRMPVDTLNKSKISIVCCKAQARSINQIMDILTDDEITVYKRGRNAKISCVPKNASVSEYHAATGLEALFGYVYLKGDIDRLREIFNAVLNLSL